MGPRVGLGDPLTDDVLNKDWHKGLDRGSDELIGSLSNPRSDRLVPNLTVVRFLCRQASRHLVEQSVIP